MPPAKEKDLKNMKLMSTQIKLYKDITRMTHEGRSDEVNGLRISTDYGCIFGFLHCDGRIIGF